MPGAAVEDQMDWQVISKRKPKPSKPRSSRPDIIIVKAKEGGPTYADILKQMKSDPSLKDVGEEVANVRRNAAGNLLLELRKSATAIAVSEAITKNLGEAASVVPRRKETTLEIRDLDELTTAVEVGEALARELRPTVEGSPNRSLRKTYRGTQNAIVRLSTDDSSKGGD